MASRRLASTTLSTLSLAAVAAAFLVPALPAAADGQAGATSGAMTGQVVDADGRPLPNVRVVATHRDRGTAHESLTGENGRYTLGLLPPGTYDVEAHLPPRPVATREAVRVTLGERITVNLELRPIQVEEVRVEIAGARRGIAEGGVVDLVDEEQIANLPTAGRDFTDFINLSGLVSPQPEVTTGGQFSIGGARTSGTNIQIDGADANNTFFAENRGSSRVPFTFSLESIQEFQLITSGFDVEYGKFSGGVVNAVTKSGTNDFQGSAHLFWRDETLTKDNFDDTPPVDFQAFQFGGVVSGPIVRDRLHYFVSGEFQEWDQPVFALDPTRANIPPATLQEFQDILIEEYGLERSFVEDQFGVFTETQDQVNLFGRLDWSMGEDHRLTLRGNYSDFESLNDRISFDQARTLGATFLDESTSLVGELNSVLAPNLFNTARIQYAKEDRPRPGHSLLPTIQVSGVETTDGRSTSMFFGGEFFGITFANNLEEEKLQITDNLTWQTGDHTLKLGGDVIFSNTLNMFWLNGNGWFLFTGGLESLREKDPLFFLRFVPDLENPTAPIADFSNQEWAFYLQDQWQATDRLLLTLGLRYDQQTFSDPGPPLANPDFQQAVQAFGVTSTDVPEDNDNIGPRVSFTYDLAGDGSEVIRGGTGVFFGRTPTVTHSNVLLTTPQPTLAVFCLFPSPEGYAGWDSPEAIPTTEEDFEDVLFCSPDAPEIAVWDPDFQHTSTLKANLGYERELSDRWRASVMGLFSRTTNLFGAVDLNLPAQPEFRTADGRPVFLPREDFDPLGVSAGDVGQDPELRRLFMHTDHGEARAWNFKLDVQGRPLDDLRVAANYTINLAYDNNSTECCTANALLFDTPTAGNPNFLGDVGDRDVGAWGPSLRERRHVFVAHAIWGLAAGLQASFIYRVQSGNPFTPSVEGDLNADGDDGNDRPFLPDPDNPAAGGYAFATPDDLAAYREFLAEESCLREAVGTIISRNTCRNPAWHSLDMKLQWAVPTVGDQRVELIADLFNVLDLLGMGAGEFVFKTSEIFEVAEYDPDADLMTVRTGDFGREIPVGFEPFQFRAQLGVRYRF